MGLIAVGTVILLEFPYADMKSYKKRPAVVVALGSLNTLVICQITSKKRAGIPAIRISEKDFHTGSLPVTSFVRPDKLFTIDRSLALNETGLLKAKVIKNIRSQITGIFS